MLCKSVNRMGFAPPGDVFPAVAVAAVVAVAVAAVVAAAAGASEVTVAAEVEAGVAVEAEAGAAAPAAADLDPEAEVGLDPLNDPPVEGLLEGRYMLTWGYRNQSPKCIKWSAVPLPCLTVVFYFIEF